MTFCLGGRKNGGNGIQYFITRKLTYLIFQIVLCLFWFTSTVANAILKRAIEYERGEILKRFFLKKKAISDDHFSGTCLLFLERNETELRNVACFIGKKKVILGTDSSTLQKGLQSRSE